MRQDSKIVIYNADGTPFRQAMLITKEAEHEEELMKSDLVRLSWRDVERYEIPIGAYIIPFPDIVGIDGQPAHFTLFKKYEPERSLDGYRYQPEFQHPKMWLGYVPFIFTTQDAVGDTVKKTDFPYVGDLSTLLKDICTFINEAYGITENEFIAFPLNIDVTQTVSMAFKDTDVLSAIAEVAKVAECEWHLSWDDKILYFGDLRLGQTEQPLVVEGNIGIPSVTRSKDKFYNAFLVHGSARNNVRRTENGYIAVNAPLLLDEEEYPDSVIDKRTEAAGGRVGPLLTQVLNIEDIYPHYELYVYDLRERHKYKKDSEGNITSEQYSIWYTRLAQKITDGQTDAYQPFLLSGTTVKLPVLAKMVRYADDATGDGHNATWEQWEQMVDDHMSVSLLYKFITLDHPFSLAYFTGSPRGQQVDVVLEYEGLQYVTAIFADDNNRMSFRPDKDGIPDSLYDTVSEGDVLTFPSGFEVNRFLPRYVDSKLVDGLVPTVAFQINNATDAQPSKLGTREFEVRFITKTEEFNSDDDVEDPQGYAYDPETGRRLGPGAPGYKYDYVTAGYYEIIKVTEGSDNLIVPTTTEQGVIPRTETDDLTSSDFPKNNKATIFNIAVDDSIVENAREELAQKALQLIDEQAEDTNNYTFPSNKVRFEADSPNLYIGQRVALKSDDVPVLHTRILKLVTKLDYEFEQEITVGNTIYKGLREHMQGEIDTLRNDFNSWKAGGTGVVNAATSGQGENWWYEERGEWKSGELYYRESLNRNTKKIETSIVTHYAGARWLCKRNLTQQEPSPDSTDWEMLSGPTKVVTVERGMFSPIATYYYNGYNAADDTIETSRVWNFGILWECRSNHAEDFPRYGSSDWVPVNEVTPELIVRRTGNGTICVGETENVNVRVTYGQQDISSLYPTVSVERDDDDGEFARKYADVEHTFSLPFGDCGFTGSVKERVFTVTASNGTEQLTGTFRLTWAGLLREDRGEWVRGEEYRRSYDKVDDLSPRVVSAVWHHGCLWEAVADAPTDEPWFTSQEWRCISGDSLWALNFFYPASEGEAEEDELPLTLVSVRAGHVDFSAKPKLLLGNEDVTEENVTAWKWTRESFDTAADATWNTQGKASQRTLHITNGDVPSGWKRGLKLSFICTATLAFDIDGSGTIVNRVKF